MKELISVSFGELTLKGKNKRTFIDKAIENIKRNIKDIGYSNIFIQSQKVYIDADVNNFDKIIKEVKKVFGIVYISKVIMCDKNLDSIKAACKKLLTDYKPDEGNTFKVLTNRVDKSFDMKSPQISAAVGGYLLRQFNDLKVDVKDPSFNVFIDIKKDAFVYCKRIEGFGGLPLGLSGKGLLLLSGGIDSPVAGFMMAKRGMSINCLHFHSYPFTSKRAHLKVEQLAELLSRYTGSFTLYSVNLTEIYKAINENCKKRETTILSRRFMMRIAERLAKREKINVLITGESLGQVASQTVESVCVIDQAVEIPILRPLIALDKTQIIEISNQIDTYEKSIEPYEDCCSIFTPQRPVTKPRLKDILVSESNLDCDLLVENAIENMEIITIS